MLKLDNRIHEKLRIKGVSTTVQIAASYDLVPRLRIPSNGCVINTHRVFNRSKKTRPLFETIEVLCDA